MHACMRTFDPGAVSSTKLNPIRKCKSICHPRAMHDVRVHCECSKLRATSKPILKQKLYDQYLVPIKRNQKLTMRTDGRTDEPIPLPFLIEMGKCIFFRPIRIGFKRFSLHVHVHGHIDNFLHIHIWTWPLSLSFPSSSGTYFVALTRWLGIHPILLQHQTRVSNKRLILRCGLLFLKLWMDFIRRKKYICKQTWRQAPSFSYPFGQRIIFIF